VNPLRPMFLALAAALCLSVPAPSTACDQNKDQARGTSGTATSYSAQKSGAACTAEMAATCTAEMAASCPMHGRNAMAAAKSGRITKAKTAGLDDCCAAGVSVKTAAVVAGSDGACAAHGMKTSAMAAGAGSCTAHGMKASAMTAGAGSCAAHGMKASAMTAGAGGSCATGAKNAVLAEGASCGGRGMLRTSGHALHPDCEACVDMETCDNALRSLGASLQVVPLKNGVMYIYTTDPAKSRAVQQTLAQRKDQMTLFASANSAPHLCPDCRQMRGAAMSGKLKREIVNIEGGCLSLMTSSDPAIVARIHALSGLAVGAGARAKL